MWILGRIVILVLGVIVEGCSGYSLFPGIFDPNPFIPKMSPQVLKVTQGQQYQPTPVVHSFTGGAVGDGEVGYVRSNSEKGSAGFRHSENFHKKDGNEYEHEKQAGYGESKGEGHGDEKSESVRKSDSEDNHDHENDRSYEVNEDHSGDHENPHQHATYGVAPTKHKKKKIQLIPEFGTRLTLPKKTSHKKNHNGYETVIYHENEKKGTEKGYDWRNRHSPPPKSVVVVHRDEQPREPEYDDRQEDELEREEQDDREESEDRDHSDDNEDDDGDRRESERSDYGDNYNSYRYGDEFAKNYDEDEEERENDRDDDRRSGNNRRSERRGSTRNNYDYDEEVDREEIDEVANEDKYYGADYDDDYGRHQYEYASEADYDAQS